MSMDYLTLIADKNTEGSIKNWVNHALIPSAQIVLEAEQWIYQRLRVRQMVHTATGTYGNSDSGVKELPSDYRAPIILHFTGVNRLFPKFVPDIGEVHKRFTYDGDGNRTTGTPRFWGTDATNIVFDIYAPTDITYNYLLLYFRSLPPLSSSNTTNFLTDRYPSLLRKALMSKAYEFQEDDKRAVVYEGKADKEIYNVEKEKDLEYLGSDMQVNVAGGEFTYYP